MSNKKESALKKKKELQSKIAELDKVINTPEPENKKIISIMDRVKSVEDACKILKTTLEKELPYKNPITPDQISENAYKELVLIIRVLNEDWIPSFGTNENSYLPYFNLSSSGFAFSFTHFNIWSTGTNVAARLCYRTRELAEFGGKHFESTYKRYMVISK